MNKSVMAVTCCTGGEKLCLLTERLVRALPMQTIVVQQDTDRNIDCDWFISVRTKYNAGFALGVNRGIQKIWSFSRGVIPNPSYVLVINNDIEPPLFPWFEPLLREADQDHICSPLTDNTGYKIAQAPGPQKGVTLAPMVGAFCWLVPFWMCEFLRSRYGFWLFDPDFGLGYGEDDYTAALLTKKLGHPPFKIVRQSWVRHFRSQTASTMKIDRGKQIRLLKEKLRGI